MEIIYMRLRKMLKILIRIPGNVRIKGENLSKKIIDECNHEKILGASVIQSIYGYGERKYEPHILRGIGDLPLIIEIIDEPMIIERFLVKLKNIVQDHGLITVEETYVV